MCFTQAGYLLSQENIGQGKRIARGRVRLAVVRRINARKRVRIGNCLIEPRRSEVLANLLRGIAERFGNPARRSCRGQQFRPIRHRPQGK